MPIELTVTLHLRQNPPPVRGIRSLNYGHVRSVRLTREEYELVEIALYKLQMPFSTFAREVVLQTAKSIIGGRNEEPDVAHG